MKHIVLLVLLFILLIPCGYAQTQFIEHKVTQGESVYSITKHYNIEPKELISSNPDLIFGLKVGQVLRIPVASQPSENTQSVTQVTTDQYQTVLVPQEPFFIIYTVKRRETLYSISRQFGITEEDIIQYNPEAKRGIKRRQVLRIPDREDLALIKALEQKQNHEEDPLTIANESFSSFFIYTVRSTDTFWELEKRYRMSQEDIIRFNPFLQDGLIAGMNLQIPIEKIPKITVFPINTYRFRNYTAMEGETVYSMASRFGITVSELKRFNPVLRYRHVINGDQILLPDVCFEEYVGERRTFNSLAYDIEIIYHDYVDCQPNTLATGKLYTIGLLVPFYLSESDNINRSVNYLHFYEGLSLAVDSLQRAGMRVQLRVFDTEQSRYNVESLVNSGKLDNLDLIIGPFFTDLQAIVSDFALKNRIPIVAPLSSSGEFEKHNPYYFKVVPDKNLLLKKTSEFITEEYYDKNLIVLNPDGQNREMIELAKEELLFTGYRMQENQIFFYEHSGNNMENLLSKNNGNIFIIPSESEAQVSLNVTNLNLLSRTFPITLVGSPNFLRFRSIQTEDLHNEKLTLVSPYFVDYKSPEVINFIRKFRRHYENEPNQYSFQGYDVAFYFLTALFNYGNDFINCLPAMKVSLTQLRPVFEKTGPNGGYINRGVTAIQHTPNFDVVNKGVLNFPLPY